MPVTPSYGINGSAASMAPHRVIWTPNVMGYDHNSAPIYASNWDVVMEFDSASITLAQQWLSQASAGGSVNLYMLDRWQIGTTILSSVYLELTTPVAVEAGHSGPFTLTVHGATPSALEVSPGA